MVAFQKLLIFKLSHCNNISCLVCIYAISRYHKFVSYCNVHYFVRKAASYDEEFIAIGPRDSDGTWLCSGMESFLGISAQSGKGETSWMDKKPFILLFPFAIVV